MQGRKYMFGILKVCNEIYSNVETKLSIFDTLIHIYLVFLTMAPSQLCIYIS